jgi:hypothetical protein
MLLCFPVLGVSVFTAAAPVNPSGRMLFIEAKGIKAQGMETRDGFVVRAGSGAVRDEVPSCHSYIRELRAALMANGVLAPDGAVFRFAQDYVFASPSTAAGVVQGRSANGRVDWKTKDGTKLKDLQEADAKP